MTLGAFGSENGKKNVLIFRADLHCARVFVLEIRYNHALAGTDQGYDVSVMAYSY